MNETPLQRDPVAWQVFQEIKWNLRGYPLARMLREATEWFPKFDD